MFPWSQCMRVCCKYYSDLTLRAKVCSKGVVKMLQFKATVWPKIASESTCEAQKFQNFLGEHPPDLPSLFCIPYCKRLIKLGGARVRGYSQT